MLFVRSFVGLLNTHPYNIRIRVDTVVHTVSKRSSAVVYAFFGAYTESVYGGRGPSGKTDLCSCTVQFQLQW